MMLCDYTAVQSLICHMLRRDTRNPANESPALILHVRSTVQMQSQVSVSVQLQSQIISILPTAQEVMSVKLNSSIQGFYE